MIVVISDFDNVAFIVHFESSLTVRSALYRTFPLHIVLRRTVTAVCVAVVQYQWVSPYW